MSSRINRRMLVKGTAGAAGAAALATSSVYHVPNVIARQEKTPVVFWTGFTAQALESLQRITDEFNAQSEDVEVTLEQIPPGEVTDSARLITAVRGGTGPDVYMLDRFIVAERAATGLLTDLTSLLEDNGADPSLSDHIGFAAAEATYEGAPYALPFDTDVRALYYNRTLLSEAGADLEAFDAANGPMTWDALKEAANMANIDNESGDNFAQMGYVPYFNQAWHYTYGFSWGADFFNEEGCEVTPNSPEMIEAMQWVYDYCAELDPSKVQAFIQAARVPGAPPQESPWTQNRLATMVTGDWQIAQNREYAPDMDYGITYLPVPEDGMESATWAGGWSLVIPEGGQQAEAATQFLMFACGEPGQRIYTEDTAHIPTLLALQEDASLFEERHTFFVNELLPTTNNRPPLPVGARYWDDMTAAFERIWLNEEEPEPALNNAKDATMTLLTPFCPIG